MRQPEKKKALCEPESVCLTLPGIAASEAAIISG
jgi:hypothetical protein